jgi:TonB family protein
MTIQAPTGCRVWINEIEIVNTKPAATLLLNQQRVKALYSPDGLITLKNVKPGSYRLSARKQDFRDYTGVADVVLDGENVFSIALIPLPARLTVIPSVEGAEVEVLNVDTGRSLGRYFHKMDQVEIVPGRYRVTTSRSGYRLSMREVTARAGESIYLEPLLEPLPTPTPTPIPTPRNIPMSLDIQRQNKFLIMHLQGSSGDAAKISGTINVTLGGPANNYVSGNLNGLPCRVELLKLDNVVDASIDEAPGPENNWSSIVVRVRPRDEKKRPISFALIWVSLTDRPLLKPSPTPSAPDTSSAPSVFVPAVATQKVQPNFPRGTAISGRVLVIVSIDSTGSVISAKATEGPYVFRRVSEEAARKWKFRPATRDGRSVVSEQTIEFKFER